MNNWIDLHALWKIVVLGLAAGAGLPALFAVGLKALSGGGAGGAQPAGANAGRGVTAATSGRVVAVCCFAVILAAVGYGLYLIVAGS